MLVLDTSTLILLAKSDLLPLVVESTRVLIPHEVQTEALAKPELYDAQLIAAMLDKRVIRVGKHVPHLQRRQLQMDFQLGPGEAAALLLAQTLQAPLGTDDGPAIKAAKILGIPFVTAMALLVALYQGKRVEHPMALALLERLQQVGRYSDQILLDARKRIGR